MGIEMMITNIVMNMKKILIALAVAFCAAGCRYDDSYLDPKLETRAYFASRQAYTRTVIVGEGMRFKIGAAMSGTISNGRDEFVDMVIDRDAVLPDGKELIADALYNSAELAGTIRATIPAGDFLGYFTVRMDSLAFLNDPKALSGEYTLPVKIIGTSLQSINEELDNVQVSVKYMCGFDGYYLYESVIRKELNGAIIEEKTTNERYPNESNNSTWRIETQGPFKAKATSAANALTNGLAFNMSLTPDNGVVYESIPGNPEITAEGINVYDPKTRDFELNYNYPSPVSDTIYHVSQKLIFRNRIVDGINQTREYLSYFN